VREVPEVVEVERRGSVVRLERVSAVDRSDVREPAYCPRCGASLAPRENLVQEYWVAEETRFYCWCRTCGFAGDVRFVERVVSHEVAE
jgi:hypothetical protein